MAAVNPYAWNVYQSHWRYLSHTESRSTGIMRTAVLSVLISRTEEIDGEPQSFEYDQRVEFPIDGAFVWTPQQTTAADLIDFCLTDPNMAAYVRVGEGRGAVVVNRRVATALDPTDTKGGPIP